MDSKRLPVISGRTLLLIVALCSSCPSLVWGRDDTVPGSRYTSARAAGMGDAFLPLPDDGAAALFYNPAALSHLKKFQVEPLNVGIQANQEYLSMLDRNFYKVVSLSSYAPTVSGKQHKAPGVAGTVFPNVSFRGFAFGILLHNEAKSQVWGNAIHYQSKIQMIPTAGVGFRLFSGILRFGYSLQYVNQASGEKIVPLTSNPLGYNQKLQEGAALSHNAGFALTLPYAYLPQFNVVARNIGNARFSGKTLVGLGKNSVGRPATEKMSFDTSINFLNKIGSGAYFNFVAEYRDATNTSKTSALQRAVFGSEFSFRDNFFLRFGVGSAYPAAGVGLRSKKAEFNLAWYSEENGLKLRSERDVRYIVQYQIRAF